MLLPVNNACVKSDQDPVVQSIVSLTSLLVVKMFSVLVCTISNSQVFLLKNVSSFCKCKSYSHFFSKNISIYAIFNDLSFNDMLTTSLVLNNWAQTAAQMYIIAPDKRVIQKIFSYFSMKTYVVSTH